VRPRQGVKIFVEGGGNDDDTRSRCRRAFNKLTERAGFAGRMPTFIACGGRRRAYDMFVTACKTGEESLLLVDSEGPIAQQAAPWEHVRRREGDGWARPGAARDEDLHFMVQCMEAWIVADRAALRTHYGPRLQENALPPTDRPPAQVPKRDLLHALDHATRNAGDYSKGKAAFTLLALVDPRALTCYWARRFFTELEGRAPRG